MSRKRYCLLATRAQDGGVDARAVQPFPPDAGLRVWMGTSPRSRKVAQLLADPRATLVYEDDARAWCVTMRGTIAIVEDLAERERRFMPSWRAFFPDGPSGEFVALRFDPSRVEVLDFVRRVTPPPFGLASAALERRGDQWTPA